MYILRYRTLLVQKSSSASKFLLTSSGLRLALASAYWYFVINFIMRPVYIWFGSCSDSTISSFRECKLSTETVWNGFDISGHVFIILHSSLIIMEELKMNITSSSNAKKHDNLAWAQDLLGTISGFVLVLWYLMLIMTCLYFHPFLEIASGALLGVGFWITVYGRFGRSILQLFPTTVPPI